ncbi:MULTISPECIES: hypothetical protein [unclassified Methylobacterium]|jgi:hypothetical protein|uniref:hypothetical protein n=1 Tax=unclassified Methylobacterium TaxID=2615210 RepID=UPI0013527B03|nr:hypothetical protein [Methylobacterium sp. 2A]MWV23261.1 hypothetical protein [Methylobacterium sp. 2A]
MKHALFASLLLAGWGLGAATRPAAALPMPVAGLQAPGDAATLVRTHRYRKRQGSASRGNAGMPSRGAGAQQYGQTTGGPRR